MEMPKKFFSREKSDLEQPEKENILVRFWFVPLVLFLMVATMMIGFWAYNQNLIKLPSTSSSYSSPVTQSPAKPEAQTVEKSDEIEKIEADLDKEDFSDLDKELNEIEADLTTP